ncbi:MAG: response regulator [Pseudomonadota bacterium]
MSAASPVRVLVVDDDEVDRLICRRALARGILPQPEVVEAQSADEAMAVAAAQRFDCVLLDYRLPDMNGVALMARLPHVEGDVPLPVVMLTGAGDVAVAVEAMRQGAIDYLVKDVEGSYQTLIPMVVQRAVRERDLRRSKLRADLALERYRVELQQLTQKLMAQEKTTTRRIAQSLHDQLGQTLAAIRLAFDAVGAAPPERRSQALERQSPRIAALLEQAVLEVRQVLVDLRPPVLDEAGLVAALDNELRSRAPADGTVALELDATPECAGLRWPAEVEYAGFMVAREAVANALRHAGASMVQVRVSGSADRLELAVEDDGRGIDEEASAGRPGHLGMVGMRERALAIGGRCSVQRNPSGGTTVSLQWEQRA